MPPIRLLSRSFIGETTAHILWAVDPPVKLRARSRIGGIFPRRSRGWRDFFINYLVAHRFLQALDNRYSSGYTFKKSYGVVVQSPNYCPVTFLGSVTFFVTPIQWLQNKCSVDPVFLCSAREVVF